MTVAEALQASRDAHDRYRDNLPRRVANGSSTVVMAGDAIVAGEALADACRYRAEAHVLDPGQTDPAWGDEAATHDHGAILDFYVDQLTRESDAVRKATTDPSGAIEDGKKAREKAETRLQSDEAISDTKASKP